MRRLTSAALAAGLWLAAAPAAWAQGPYVRPATVNPYYRPPFSPYLNLRLPGNPAINYYGLVRPQVEFASSIQQLQTQEAQTEALLYGGQAQQTAPVTGVPAGFMNFSHYYGGRISSGVGVGAYRPAVLPPATVPPAVLPFVGGAYGTGPGQPLEVGRPAAVLRR